MSLYQQAFGSTFDLGIVVPDFFVDQSYKNDVSPCFVHYCDGGRAFVLWVDFAEAEKREFPESQRYILELHIQEKCCYRILETNSPERITAMLESLENSIPLMMN